MAMEVFAPNATMYSSFKLSSEELDVLVSSGLANHDASPLYAGSEKKRRACMNKALTTILQRTEETENALEATEIRDEYFPAIKADVFISHSRKDAKKVKRFKSCLFHQLGLNAVTDSEVWGYYQNWLQKLHDKYCEIPGENVYDYQRFVTMANHAFTMLTYVLTRMIDQTESFLFIESPHSVTKGRKADLTCSPWIFHELATVRTIRRTLPPRLRTSPVTESVNTGKGAPLLPPAAYPVFKETLAELSLREMALWFFQYDPTSGKHALELLYQIASRKTP